METQDLEWGHLELQEEGEAEVRWSSADLLGTGVSLGCRSWYFHSLVSWDVREHRVFYGLLFLLCRFSLLLSFLRVPGQGCCRMWGVQRQWERAWTRDGTRVTESTAV